MGGAIREKAYSNKIQTLDLKRGIWYELEGTLPALRTGEWWRLCDLKDGVSYPGLASDGSYIYIFENRNLQVYHIETDTMRIYELAALDVENAGLFYWRNTLYIVGGCNCQGIYVAPHRDVIAIDVSQINP